jgi:hypothetical protein
MNKLPTVVAALLLGQMITTHVAVVAKEPENSGPEYLNKDTVEPRKQKKSKKIIAMMRSVGLYDAALANFVSTVDKHVNDGELMLYKDRVADGNLSLRYDFSPEDDRKKLGLYYTPDNSNYEYRMHTNSVNVTYKFKF